ncbi:lipid A biosynthesis acyltransferase, partial [Flavihumibacter sp. CACIAM 22H1]|uniref:lysophospholipid acyltransferase family protein n=1 Tax=Flavihumibacter sp. CACIAM 22H1 TaxID=1812911 RepID=UPI0007A86091
MYYFVYGFLYLVSLAPIRVLYAVGDLLGWLIFELAGYRRAVVNNNLRLAFPAKTDLERTRIRRTFQRNFIDTFIETIKLISAGKSFITSRMQGDFEKLNDLYDRGLRCQVHMGHNFNWELANLAYGYYCKHPLLGVYMPLKNKAMDKLFRQLRSKTGTILLPATSMKKSMLPYRDTHYLLGLVADQVPANVQQAYWLNFFNHPTAFIPGPEKGARTGNLPVAFVHITKEKRGYYYLHVKIAAEDPVSLPEGELTRMYRDFLEETIRQDPAMWLWSHRRWKK